MYTEVLFLLTALCTYTQACICMPNHPQNSFCKADFAMHVEVLSKKRYTTIDNMQHFKDLGIMLPRFANYKIRIIQVFKGQDILNNLQSPSSVNSNELEIRTPENNNVCGVKFAKGKQYLITGRIINGQLNVNQCDWSAEWDQLTNRMRQGINGDYDCSCHVATCIDGYCDRNIGCKWQVTWDRPLDECKMKHSACKRSLMNNCKWDANCP